MAEEKFISDPGLYRELSAPFPSIDAANAALKAFVRDLREIRKKHRIADVHVIISGVALHEDGKEQPFILSSHQGDPMRAEQMTAWAFGQAQADRQMLVADLMSQGKSIKRMRSGK